MNHHVFEHQHNSKTTKYRWTMASPCFTSSMGPCQGISARSQGLRFCARRSVVQSHVLRRISRPSGRWPWGTTPAAQKKQEKDAQRKLYGRNLWHRKWGWWNSWQIVWLVVDRSELYPGLWVIWFVENWFCNMGCEFYGYREIDCWLDVVRRLSNMNRHDLHRSTWLITVDHTSNYCQSESSMDCETEKRINMFLTPGWFFLRLIIINHARWFNGFKHHCNINTDVFINHCSILIMVIVIDLIWHPW